MNLQHSLKINAMSMNRFCIVNCGFIHKSQLLDKNSLAHLLVVVYIGGWRVHSISIEKNSSEMKFLSSCHFPLHRWVSSHRWVWIVFLSVMALFCFYVKMECVFCEIQIQHMFSLRLCRMSPSLTSYTYCNFLSDFRVKLAERKWQPLMHYRCRSSGNQHWPANFLGWENESTTWNDSEMPLNYGLPKSLLPRELMIFLVSKQTLALGKLMNVPFSSGNLNVDGS